MPEQWARFSAFAGHPRRPPRPPTTGSCAPTPPPATRPRGTGVAWEDAVIAHEVLGKPGAYSDRPPRLCWPSCASAPTTSPTALAEAGDLLRGPRGWPASRACSSTAASTSAARCAWPGTSPGPGPASELRGHRRGRAHRLPGHHRGDRGRAGPPLTSTTLTASRSVCNLYRTCASPANMEPPPMPKTTARQPVRRPAGRRAPRRARPRGSRRGRDPRLQHGRGGQPVRRRLVRRPRNRRLRATRYWVYPTTPQPYDEQTFLDAFSSTDLVTWTKHPNVLDHRQRVLGAIAPCGRPRSSRRDGKYYLFFARQRHPEQRRARRHRRRRRRPARRARTRDTSAGR